MTHSDLVGLNETLITAELSQRVPRLPDLQAENQALQTLARQLAERPQAMLETLVNMAQDLCNAGSAGVSLVETTSAGETILRWVTVSGALEDNEQVVLSRFSPCGIALEHQSPQLYFYPERYFTDLQRIKPTIVESLVIPLIVADQPLGAIWIVAHDQQRHFDAEDLRILSSLAHFTTASLTHWRDIRERKQIEETLRQREAELRLITDAVPVLISFVDSEQRYRFNNRTYEEWFGRSASEVYGKHLREILGEAAYVTILPYVERVLAGEQVTFETQVPYREGGTRYINATYIPQVDNRGTVIGFVVLVNDISERQKADWALRESESRFRYIFEAAGISIWEQNFSQLKIAIDQLKAQGVKDFHQYFVEHPEFVERAIKMVSIVDVNQITVQLFEAEDKKQLLDSLQNIFLPETRDVFIGELLALAEERTFFEAETVLKTLAGERLNVLITITFPPTTAPFDRVLVNLVNITDRKRVEEALQRSEQRLRRLVEANIFGVAFGDYYGNIFEANEAFLNIIDCDRETLLAGGVRWDQLTPPEFLHLDAQCHVELRQFGVCKPFEKEYVLQDGRRVPVLVASALLQEPYDQDQEIIGFILDLTEQKRAEAALSEQRLLMETILRQAADAIMVTDTAGNLSFLNAQARRLAGLDPDDTTLDLALTSWGEAYDSNGQLISLENNVLLKALHGEVSNAVELRMVRADGSSYDILMSAAPLRNSEQQIVGAVSTFMDITERKQVEEALRQSEERYRYLAEALPQQIWTANAEGRNDYVNQHMCDYVGLTAQQLLGWGWHATVHPDDLARVTQGWAEAVQKGMSYEAEYRVRRADGMYRWHLVRGIPLKDEWGYIVKWFGVSTDIHQKQELEEQRSRLLQREQAARAEAEAANRVKDEFLAVLSHELRSPLNPIVGWSKLLRTRKLDDATSQRALETIERNAQIQAQLIEDLLDVSRILRGKLSLHIVPIDLATTIEAAIETVRLAAEAKAITLTTDFAPQLGPVAGDAGRLQQVVWNLLSNAVKFTPQGGHISVRLEQLELEQNQLEQNQLEQTGRSSLSPSPCCCAQITVSDTGKGIPADFLPHVFDYFRQADATTTRTFGGLGLGLAIVRHLVELHGGEVQAESAGEGQGASFRVRLPLSSSSVKADTSGRSVSSASLEGVKVLVVDDDEHTREFVVFLLQLHGAVVRGVGSGQEGLAVLREMRPDVLMSDIGMPEMDGYMLMERVRGLGAAEGGETPAIALTAYAGEIDYRQAMAAGFNKHLAKPVEPDQLIAAVANLIENKSENHH